MLLNGLLDPMFVCLLHDVDVRLLRVFQCAPVVGEKLLHPWIGGPIRSAASRRGGHSAAAGRCTERSHAAEAVMRTVGGGMGGLFLMTGLCSEVVLTSEDVYLILTSVVAKISL